MKRDNIRRSRSNRWILLLTGSENLGPFPMVQKYCRTIAVGRAEYEPAKDAERDQGRKSA